MMETFELGERLHIVLAPHQAGVIKLVIELIPETLVSL